MRIKNFNFYFQTVVLAVVRFQNPNEDIKLFLNYDTDGSEI